MKTLTTLLWDAGGVIYSFDQGRVDRVFAANCHKSAEEVSAVLYGGTASDKRYNAGLVGDFNLGVIDAPRFYSRVKKKLELRMNYNQFVDAWNSAFKGVNSKIAAFIEQAARKGIPQGILSSTNPLHWSEMNRTLDLETLLGRKNIICTYHPDAGANKPEPKLFDAALERLGKQKAEVVYVDDLKKYTDAALQYGFGAAIHVDNNQKDFQERCILSLNELGFAP